MLVGACCGKDPKAARPPTRRCSHFRRGCQSGGNRWMSPSRRKLSTPSSGAARANKKVSSPTLPCSDVKCCLPCSVCTPERARDVCHAVQMKPPADAVSSKRRGTGNRPAS